MWKDFKTRTLIKLHVETGMGLPEKTIAPDPLDAGSAEKIYRRGFGGDFSYWSSITPEAAYVISKQNANLFLGGLSHLTDECADLIGQSTGGILNLSGLKTLSDSAASSLSSIETYGRSHFNIILLTVVDSLSDFALQELSKHNGDTLKLGVTELSEKAAAALGACTTNRLGLDNLTHLSDVAAGSLVHREGDLSLGGVTSITKGVAAALAKVRGILTLGVEQISDDAVRELSGFSGGWLLLPRLESLSAIAAESLGKMDASVDLGLKHLPESVAELLSKNTHKISLGKLEVLSDIAAEKIGNASGSISFDKLEELSDIAAEKIGNSSCESVGLMGLKKLSKKGARHLLKFKGHLSFFPRDLPRSAASILRLHHSWRD